MIVARGLGRGTYRGTLVCGGLGKLASAAARAFILRLSSAITKTLRLDSLL